MLYPGVREGGSWRTSSLKVCELKGLWGRKGSKKVSQEFMIEGMVRRQEQLMVVSVRGGGGKKETIR